MMYGTLVGVAKQERKNALLNEQRGSSVRHHWLLAARSAVVIVRTTLRTMWRLSWQ